MVSTIAQRPGTNEFLDSWYEPTIDRPAITSALHCFLEQKFLFWLEVLSVLGVAKDAIDALGVAAKWLEVCQVSMLESSEIY